MPTVNKKATMEELFKNGADFKFKNIDWGSSEITKQLKELREEQDRVMRLQVLDLYELSKIYITI